MVNNDNINNQTSLDTVKNKKKTIEKIVNIALFILCILYWICYIIKCATGDIKLASIIIWTLMNLPFTILIGIHNYRFGVLFVLVYSIFIFLTNTTALLQQFQEGGTRDILAITGIIASILYGIFMIITSVRLMRNKENKYKYIIAILMTVAIVIKIIISMTRYIDFSTLMGDIASIMLLLMQGIFYIFFPDICLKIFKD